MKNTNTVVKLAIPYGCNQYGKDKIGGQGGRRTAGVALRAFTDAKLLLEFEFPSISIDCVTVFHSPHLGRGRGGRRGGVAEHGHRPVDAVGEVVVHHPVVLHHVRHVALPRRVVLRFALVGRL